MSWHGHPPTLTGKDNRELLRQAIDHISRGTRTPREMADCFDELVPQIDARGGGFKASRTQGVDGSHIFVGVVVISPRGEIFRGSLQGTPAQQGPAGVRLTGQGLEPDYGALRLIKA